MNSQPKKKVRLLYCAEASSGGIAEYVKFHARALAESGLEVTVLCREDYPHKDLQGIIVRPQLPVRRQAKSSFGRLINYLSDSREISRCVLNLVNEGCYDYVLLDCFREYLSPFWVGAFKKARGMGIRFGVVAHDPVRDFVVGPFWWHRFSIRMAYSFIDDVFVHDQSRIDFGASKPEGIRVYEIPHGPFEHPAPIRDRRNLREELGFNDDDLVFLSFGQIRDGKNLDLILKAMPKTPEKVKLLVAGRSDSGSQKSPAYYQDLARTSGIEARCQWLIRYVKDEEISEIFDAADVVLLTYSNAFVSASGVLNIAVERGKPVLASGGDGPLKTAVTNYPIGRWVENLHEESIVSAMNDFTDKHLSFEFSSFLEAHSWKRNARTVMNAIIGAMDENYEVTFSRDLFSGSK